MNALRNNLAEAEQRKQEDDLSQLQLMAQAAMANATGRQAGPRGDKPRAGGAPAGQGGPLPGVKWPAIGEAHQHTSGYDFAKWSGDINVPGSGDLGNPVGAYKRGKVIDVQRLKDSYGKHITIQHPNGTSTLYAHLSKIGVRPGDRVRKGQIIGKVGNTGNSSGPHLHFEIR